MKLPKPESLGDVAICFGILYFGTMHLVFESQDSESEKSADLDVVASLLKSCHGIEADGNRSRILQGAEIVVGSTGTKVIVRDVNSTCLPKDPFLGVLSDHSTVRYVEFYDSNITIIDYDAFDYNSTLSYYEIAFHRSTIEYMMNQSYTKFGFHLLETKLLNFPEVFGAIDFRFESISNFSFTPEFAQFFVSAPRKHVEFYSVLDDQMLVDFAAVLAAAKNPLNMTEPTFASNVITFQENGFSKFPAGIIHPEVLQFPKHVFLRFLFEPKLEHFDEKSLIGQTYSRYQVSFNGCKMLSSIPEAINDLDVSILTIDETNISSLEGLNVSAFSDFAEINMDETPILSECLEVDYFKSLNGLKNSTYIYPCDDILILS
eukprot:snap_masked-scaffold_38-processed-gene-2.59-mRNA-1 protein AED:1.00 eAED:1.00 QI:0/0/0/0/1/1/2/0/374